MYACTKQGSSKGLKLKRNSSDAHCLLKLPNVKVGSGCGCLLYS